MFFNPLKLADWNIDQFRLRLQLLSVLVIIVLLVYIVFSSKDKEK